MIEDENEDRDIQSSLSSILYLHPRRLLISISGGNGKMARIVHLGMRADDIDKASEFYSKVSGSPRSKFPDLEIRCAI